MEKTDAVILVTGATGKQGGAVVRRLMEDGWPVRIFTRNPYQASAQEFVRCGAQVAQGDLSDRGSIAEALQGVYGVFSVQQPWESGPEVETQQGIALAQEAQRAGVRHFIYSSMGCAQCRTGVPFFESKWEIELHVRSLAMTTTILRPAFFMENFLSPGYQHGINRGVLALALSPNKPLQLVAVDDIAAFATLAFNFPEAYSGKEIELAGDELTGEQMAEVFQKALDRPVTFQQLSLDELRQVNEASAQMFDWLNIHGYIADIAALRVIYPELQTLERWLAGDTWSAAEEEYLQTHAHG